MKCTSCSTELSDSAKFCPECGAKIIRKVLCPKCGTEAAPGDKFCSECGYRLNGGDANAAKESSVSQKQDTAAEEGPQSKPQADDPLTRTVKAIIADMVQIPGKDYSMGKTTITQAKWQMLMGNNPSYSKGDNRPVDSVSWDDCATFVAKLNAHPSAKESGMAFRLPTRSEWEYAARAGATGVLEYCRLADGTIVTDDNFKEIVGTDEQLLEYWKQGVRFKKANAFGLYDCALTLGYEWTSVPLGKWHLLCSLYERRAIYKTPAKKFIQIRLAASKIGVRPKADIEQESKDAIEEFGASCYKGGNSWLHGQFINLKAAVERFQEGMEIGHLPCVNQLGMRYMLGEGVGKDEAKACSLFNKAALGGLPDAMCNLGCCYLEGIGVGKDETKGMDWLGKAERLGFEEATKAINLFRAKNFGRSFMSVIKRFPK